LTAVVSPAERSRSQKDYKIAKKMVEEMSYHRRDPELEALAKALEK